MSEGCINDIEHNMRLAAVLVPIKEENDILHGGYQKLRADLAAARAQVAALRAALAEAGEAPSMEIAHRRVFALADTAEAARGYVSREEHERALREQSAKQADAREKVGKASALAAAHAMREAAAKVLRCARTGHPCGTDTEAFGSPCECGPCVGAAAIRALPLPEGEPGVPREVARALVEALRPLAKIADAGDSDRLDEWSAKFDSRDHSEVPLVTTGGGGNLLTLADCYTARAAIAAAEKAL